MSAPGTDEQAAAIGKAVVNSPLVKTAVNGCDPNRARLVCSIGDHLGAQPAVQEFDQFDQTALLGNAPHSAFLTKAGW